MPQERPGGVSPGGPERHKPFFDDFAWWDEGDVLTQITPTRVEYIRGVAGDLRGCRLLDLGCGGGLISEPLARSGAKVVGIDISGNSLRTARKHAGYSGLEISYLQSPAESLPFRDGSFDTVVAFDVLEHVDDLPTTVEEVSRVLRPGGKFIYDTMNRTLVCRIIVIWIGEHLWRGGPPRGTHQWEKLIKPEELIGLMTANGIANQETRGFIPRGVDRRGRLLMGYAPYKGLSYVGYGIKQG